MNKPVRDELIEIMDNFPQREEMLDALSEYVLDRILRGYGQGMRFADQGHTVPEIPSDFDH